ncbi:NADP-dependent oxidoreductase [Sphingoaurantiacus capsulatus]|uniref:NADP-dependent oxidoreductase n=1 Tax=Sphingoaurantiacus capsulatus TaxID=1771310 RepID=A0ABV7XBN0_9SPHN
MAGFTSREVRLKSRPVGMPQAGDFEVGSVELASPGEGQVLVRNRWMSVDPYMRGRMYDRPSYVPPFQVGKPLEGGAVGEVVASGSPDFKPGDLVMSMLGWREGFVAPANTLEKLPADAGVPVEAFLGILGMPGLTAYAGLLEIGQPKEGDTVFVSGGAGAVGSIVAQIAKIKGCTVVATAGSDEKCAWLKSVGVDHAINYKKGNLLEAVRAAAPKGIDVYFDNVGGEHLEVALELAKPFARFAECGMIAQYNNEEPAPGPRNLIYVVGKSLKIQGFIVTQFAGLRPQFIKDMSGWIAGGKLKWEQTVETGVDNAAGAFLKLFSGGNTGKMLVKL